MPGFYLRSVAILALLVPALALTSAVGGPIIIYTSSLIALVAMCANAVKHWEPFEFGELSWMSVALATPLAVMLVNSAVLGIWSSSELEKLLRFALAIPVAWLLLRVPRRWLQQVQWSLLAGAYAGSVMLFVIMLSPDLGRGAVSEYGGRYNAVAFADLTLFFGLASCLTLPGRLSRFSRLEAVLKIFVVPLSLWAAWLSQTRSCWALLVVFGVVLLLANRHWSLRAKTAFVAGLSAFVVAGAVFAWHAKESRFAEVRHDLTRYEHQDRDTSVGIRLQLWQASWLMFKEKPLTGVGAPNFRAELARLHDQGVVTKLVATKFGEPHNDFLGALAMYGLPGLLSILALYFIPAAIFFRRLGSSDPVTRMGAKLGLLFTLGYATFSLTEMMFRSMRSVPIYAVTVVVLFALSSERARSKLARK